MQRATDFQTHNFLTSLTSTFINSMTSSTNKPINNSISTIEQKPTIQLGHPALGIFLSLFCFITVFGNGLVIYAIVQERYLKSATYYYMASLACADLFVGLIVMPFAIVQVLYGDYWPFGKTCCDLWHSIDVCASTASILDLCVIALDRYSAITNPMSYHRTFFVKRWPYLLVAVWLCSGLISFPAIAYWRLVLRHHQVDRCLFPDDIYFILFSSSISFYIPLFVMIFVYIRIYRAAIKQLHAFKTGVKLASPTTKKKRKGLKNNDNTPANAPADICLRIHRGKYHGIPAMTHESSSTINHADPIHTSSSTTERLNLPTDKSSNHIKKSSSGAHLNDHKDASLLHLSMPTLATPVSLTTDHNQSTVTHSNLKKPVSQDTLSTYDLSRASKANSTSATSTSIGKRLTKFSKEQKATITLAYVMGIFVICWLPFFVYNPLTAIAKLFIQQDKHLTSIEHFLIGNELIFQMFTWLGYVNSSVNPIIYAYSSREFRRAFVKYLCRCFPLRLRNFMMSYHNLHLLRYRRGPESNISKDINESGSDHNHHINNYTNQNKQHVLLPSPSTTTSITYLQNKNSQNQEYKTSEHSQNEHSRIWLLTNCCKPNKYHQNEQSNKHSSISTSSKTLTSNNIIVDYCTYHDVAVTRVTCL